MATQLRVRWCVLAPLALACSALLGLTGCAGGPTGKSAVTVVAGEPTRIALTQTATQQVLLLQNASAAARKDVYSDKQSQKTLKVIDDEQMQKLLDVLADNAFFSHAVAQPAGDAKELIAIEQSGRTWVWSRRPYGADSADAIQAFATAKAYVMSVYNSATAFHAAKGVSTDDLYLEQQRIEKAGKEARAKAEGMKGGSGKQDQPRPQ